MYSMGFGIVGLNFVIGVFDSKFCEVCAFHHRWV